MTNVNIHPRPAHNGFFFTCKGMESLCLEAVEMHTCGEPLRIVHSGVPPIIGETILQKWNYIIEHLDYIRKLVILEPRGHRDMYGALLVDPDVPGADLACIFLYNKYYGTMCGHGVIALARYAIDHGRVRTPTSPETRVVIQCPCGPVETFVEYKNGRTGRVRFHSVPAFVHDLDVNLELPEFGRVKVDISYGGAFYVVLPAASLGLDLKTSSVSELVKAADTVTGTDVLKKREEPHSSGAMVFENTITDLYTQRDQNKTTTVSEVAKKAREIHHPEGSELAFICGTVLTDGNDIDGSIISNNLVVLGDQQVDRSPCGSGTTSRIALQYARGQIQLDEQRIFQGPAGASFTAKVVRQLAYGSYDNAVVVEISGRAYYTGTSTFTLDEEDVIGRGFLLK